MEYKAKRRTLKVEIDGTAHCVRFPKYSELDAFTLELKENPTEALQKFLVVLGLPLEAQRELEAEDFNEIVAIISGQKKIDAK